MNRYKVLWIDDQAADEENVTFLDLAYKRGLDIEVALCFEDGVLMIEDNSKHWDAIILDVNCKISNSDANESLDSFTEATHYMRSYCEKEEFVPWFVYTGGAYEGFDSINSRIPKKRDWDDRAFYNKPSDMEPLFANVKKAAGEQLSTQVKLKYADVVGTFDNMQRELIHILTAVESETTDKSTYLNEIRNTLMKIRDVFIGAGITPKSLSIKDISRHLGGCKNDDVLVPSYIQLSLYSCIEITNSGSHGELPAAADTNEGKAPYLLRSTAFALLNVILWLKYITQSSEDVCKLTEYFKGYTPSTTTPPSPAKDICNSSDECYVGVVEQDDNGYYHCGSYLLPRNISTELIGKTISITKSKPNDRCQTKELYEMFAYGWK